ncbi:MAG: hypothetical protein IJ802_01840 [Kiritimatiellae bacterium]|nr:hypothetical protein [Kiritimatiellia bacterium]
MTSDDAKRRAAAAAHRRREEALGGICINGLPVDADVVALRREIPSAEIFFGKAADGLIARLEVENPFWDEVQRQWMDLFPTLLARPGRMEGDKLYVYVISATTAFTLRRQLPKIKKALKTLPYAPKKLAVLLEIHQYRPSGAA